MSSQPTSPTRPLLLANTPSQGMLAHLPPAHPTTQLDSLVQQSFNRARSFLVFFNQEIRLLRDNPGLLSSRENGERFRTLEELSATSTRLLSEVESEHKQSTSSTGRPFLPLTLSTHTPASQSITVNTGTTPRGSTHTATTIPFGFLEGGSSISVTTKRNLSTGTVETVVSPTVSPANSPVKVKPPARKRARDKAKSTGKRAHKRKKNVQDPRVIALYEFHKQTAKKKGSVSYSSIDKFTEQKLDGETFCDRLFQLLATSPQNKKLRLTPIQPHNLVPSLDSSSYQCSWIANMTHTNGAKVKVKIDNYVQAIREDARDFSKPIHHIPYFSETFTKGTVDHGNDYFYLKLFDCSENRVPYDDEAKLIIRFSPEGNGELVTLKASEHLSGTNLNNIALKFYELLGPKKMACHDDSKVKYPSPDTPSETTEYFLRMIRPIVNSVQNAVPWYGKFGYQPLDLLGRETELSKKLEIERGHFQSSEILTSAINHLRDTKLSLLSNFFQKHESDREVKTLTSLSATYFSGQKWEDLTIHQLASKIFQSKTETSPLDFSKFYDLYHTKAWNLCAKTSKKKQSKSKLTKPMLSAQEKLYFLAIETLYNMNLCCKRFEKEPERPPITEVKEFSSYLDQAVSKKAKRNIVFTSKKVTSEADQKQENNLSAAKRSFYRAQEITRPWQLVLANSTGKTTDSLS